jgi:tetratricopeptide (TPR) repeat protein
MKQLVALLTVVACFAVAAPQLSAQMGTGRVAGTVKDTEGKPIAGAEVVAEPEGGGNKLDAVTNAKGEWGILGFRNGRYSFTVTAEGYQPERTTTMVQQLSRNPRMDIVLQKLQKGTAFGGEKISALLSEGNQAFEQKNYPEALAKYQALLAESPTLYQIRLNIGNVYKVTGELDKALAEYEQVLAEEPQNLAALVNMGEVLVKKDELEKAVAAFEKAMAQNPSDEAIPFNVAEIYFNTGNTDKAIEMYQKAATAKPDWVDPVLKLGYAYLNKGDLVQAAAQMEKVMTMAPESPQAQIAKGVLDSIKPQN